MTESKLERTKAYIMAVNFNLVQVHFTYALKLFKVVS